MYDAILDITGYGLLSLEYLQNEKIVETNTIGKTTIKVNKIEKVLNGCPVLFNFYCEDNTYYVRYRGGTLEIYRNHIEESSKIYKKTIG